MTMPVKVFTLEVSNVGQNITQKIVDNLDLTGNLRFFSKL